MELPVEIYEKIYYFYVSIYMNKMKEVHEELLRDRIYLYLSEKVFKFEMDFEFAERIPRLVS
tara:strand:- start:93 stop:278 length:186 start_codon:yes stop_codon:yes gene_type:complete